LPANIPDRDGARGLLQSARRRFPFIKKIFADARYLDRKCRKPSWPPAAGKSNLLTGPTSMVSHAAKALDCGANIRVD
jgi:hypothetical protein